MKTLETCFHVKLVRSNTVFGKNTVERRYSSKLGTNIVERMHLVYIFWTNTCISFEKILNEPISIPSTSSWMVSVPSTNFLLDGTVPSTNFLLDGIFYEFSIVDKSKVWTSRSRITNICGSTKPKK